MSSAVTAAAPPSADAGYAVKGKQFKVVETWVTLPHAATFAPEAGRIGASVQLWTASEVIDLRVTSCTDRSCAAGGRPVTAEYRPVLDVYNRTTHALICSSVSSGSARCKGHGFSGFENLRYRAGTNVPMSLVYFNEEGIIYAVVRGWDFFYDLPPVESSSLLDFTQARITAEFGVSPWAQPRLRAPSGRMTVMSFDRPTPPPYQAEVGNFAGHAGGFVQAWWTHSRLATAPAPGVGTASPLRDDGYGFTVYLER